MYNPINLGQDFVYSQRHLQSVLLQVVWLPEPDILDVGGQAAARVVSIIKHHSLQVAVQDVDSERRAAVAAAAAAAMIENKIDSRGAACLQVLRNVWGSRRGGIGSCGSPFGQVFNSPVLFSFLPAGLGSLPAADFIWHVPTVVLPAALQSSGNAATWRESKNGGRHSTATHLNTSLNTLSGT